MKLDTLNELKHVLRDKLRQLDGIQTTCKSCEHFADGKRCTKWQAEPPAEYQTQPGLCPDWHYDQIPF